MLKTEYATIILYVLVGIVYIISIKNPVKFERRGKTDTADPLDDVKRILKRFRPYFFTFWNFVLQIIFLVTALLDESSKLLKLPLTVQKLTGRTRAFLFNALIFPSTLLVITVFWSLWYINRELIFPKVLDEFFPNWLNQILHTFIIVPLIIEIALPKKYNFVQFRNAALVFTIYAIIYGSLYISIYLIHGVWLYPVCNILTWHQIGVLALVLLGVALVYQKIGIVLQNRKRMRQGMKFE